MPPSNPPLTRSASLLEDDNETANAPDAGRDPEAFLDHWLDD